MSTPPVAPEPGWYADPAGEDVARWWDGSSWTAVLSDDLDAAAPAGVTDPGASEGQVNDATEAIDETPSAGTVETPTNPWLREAPNPNPVNPSSPQSEPQSEPQPGPDEEHLDTLPAPRGRPVRVYPPGYERRSRHPAEGEPARTSGRTPRIVGAAAVLVAIVVAVGAVVFSNRAPADPLAGPLVEPGSVASSATPTPSASAGATPSYDAATRRLTVGAFGVTMPGAPYVTEATTLTPTAGLLSSGIGSDAVVHQKYDGKNAWTASVVSGVIDPALVDDADAVKTGRQVLNRFVGLNFATIDETVKLDKPTAVGQEGVKQGVILQGRVNYRVKGVSSSYDRLSVLAFQTRDGTWIAWMSLRPEKSSAATKTALQNSISSITTV